MNPYYYPLIALAIIVLAVVLSLKRPSKKGIKRNVVSMLLILMLCSCAQFPHLISGGKEYVRLSQLNLTNKEKFRLDWMTDYKSEWAIVDPRFGGFIFDQSFSYDSLLSK